jgi:feruloyl esterase
MRRKRSAVAAISTLVLLVTVGRTTIAQNRSEFRDWKPSALADATQVKPRVGCSSLLSLTGYDLSITTATTIPATADLPEYCRVVGLIQPEIRFEVNLPTSWNGRLYMLGNGGFAGEPLDAPVRVATTQRALAQGFATAQTNTGHEAAVEPGATFAASPQKFADYAYRAVHLTALTAKRVAQAYYETAPRRSYFDGCSTGGRQGLISAQRFPDDFDGIAVGAPVLSFSGTMVSYVNNQRALRAAPMTVEKLKIVADAVYAKCDIIDGVKDGVIDDPRRCAFKPAADLPRCTGEAGGANCFSAAEVRTLETIYGGVARNGVPFLAGWPVGVEIGGPQNAPPSGWLPWLIAAPGAVPAEQMFGDSFFKHVAFGRPNPSYDWMTFNVDADYDKIAAARAALDAVDPDLSRFKARGGKIISYFGWADPALNPLMGINYYESVVARMGPSTADFYRLFMVPGMFHCSGGVGTGTFDAFTPLVEWVEKGLPPASIHAVKLVDGKPVRTRPLCPYPEIAKYKGTGSVDDAANFSCMRPQPDVR